MKLSIAAIALLFGVNSLAATITVKGRALKGQTKVKKSKKSKDPCPKRTAYNAPVGCNHNCYSDMTKLSTDINAALAVPGPTGPTFTGTVCSGTWVWPATASVSGALPNAKLDLSCCGSENSCVITGETPSVTRTTSVMEFNSPAHVILQGLSFVKINGTEAGAGLLYTDKAVVEVKNVMVDSVLSSSYPGGVFYFQTTQATISDSKFTNNQNLLEGGVIQAYYGLIRMNGNAFVGNKAESHGGTLYSHVSTLLATCNTFENNSVGYYGGAIFGYAANLQLTNNKFLGNQVNQGEGGAIFGYNANLQLTNNQFLGNQANHRGGAIALDYSAMVSIGNTYSNNDAYFSGGAVDSYYGVNELVDDIFTENLATFGSNVRLYSSVLKYCNCPTLTSETIFAEDSTSQLLAQCV